MSYTKTDCEQAILRAKSKCDGYLGADDYRKLSRDDDPSVATIANKYGSWTEAKESTDLDALSNTASRTPGNAKSIDTSYFNLPLNQEEAYWLGFIYADAHITESSTDDRPRFSLQISEKDEDHLRKFKSAVDSDHKINEHNGNVGLHTTNKEFCESLLQHGLRGDKTFNGSLPDLSDNIFHSWVRGLFDGDGYTRFHGGSPNIVITGSAPRMRVLLDRLPVDGTCVEEGNPRLNFYGDNAREMAALMYPEGANTAPRLDRKYPEWF